MLSLQKRPATGSGKQILQNITCYLRPMLACIAFLLPCVVLERVTDRMLNLDSWCCNGATQTMVFVTGCQVLANNKITSTSLFCISE